MAEETCADCSARYSVGARQCPHCESTRRLPEDALDQLVPCRKVACSNGQCGALGVVRRVALAQVVPGVLVLPTLLCAACGLELANVNEESNMPKITAHGGATNAAADTEEGEDVSAGTSSATSSEKEPTSPGPSENKVPSPARKTASRSKKGPTGTSTVPSTDGDPTAPSSATDEDDS